MNPRRLAIPAVVAAAVAAGLVAILRPSPPEEFPLADLVPRDALFYAGFQGLEDLERAAAAFPPPWSESVLDRLRRSRRHLAGGVAIYVDREGEWVFLARLKKVAAMVTDVEVDGGAAVIAQSPAALGRHRKRAGTLLENREFRALGRRIFVNLEALQPPVRLRDFTALGLDFAPGPPLVLRGRANYRGGFYRLYLEHYVHAPLHGPPRAAVGLAFSDHFPRLWDEFLRCLSGLDRARVEDLAHLLARDVPDIRTVREFLRRVGPTWGVSLASTPRGKPALSGWIDFPDTRTLHQFWELLQRSAQEVWKYALDGGRRPLYEISMKGAVTHVHLPGPLLARHADACAPVYTILPGNRLAFATHADLLDPPALGPGDAHIAASVDVRPALEAGRFLVDLFTDAAFLEEAERTARRDFTRVYSPGVIEARRRQLQARYPNEPRRAQVELAKFLDAELCRLAAEALGRLSETPDYRQERARREAAFGAWERRLGWLDRVTLDARFAGQGLELELRAWPRVGARQER